MQGAHYCRLETAAMNAFKRAFKADPADRSGEQGKDHMSTGGDKDLESVQQVAGLGGQKREDLGPEAQKGEHTRKILSCMDGTSDSLQN